MHESFAFYRFQLVTLHGTGSDQTTLLQSRVQVSIDGTDALATEAPREHVCPHDLVIDHQ
jgi:hypothetical protein